MKLPYTIEFSTGKLFHGVANLNPTTGAVKKPNIEMHDERGAIQAEYLTINEQPVALCPKCRDFVMDDKGDCPDPNCPNAADPEGPTKNTKHLKGYACPSCGSLTPLSIWTHAKIYVEDDYIGGAEEVAMGDLAVAECEICHYKDVLKRFRVGAAPKVRMLCHNAKKEQFLYDASDALTKLEDGDLADLMATKGQARKALTKLINIVAHIPNKVTKDVAVEAMFDKIELHPVDFRRWLKKHRSKLANG